MTEMSGPRLAPWVAPVNALLSPADPLVRALSRFSLLERAAGLRGADDETGFLDGMRVLHEHIQAADLTPLGRLAMRTEIARRLSNRGRVLRTLRADPELAEAPVRRPVFVTGLPRTGTSLLHGLLGHRTGARAPMFWELLHPAARGGEAAGRRLTTRMLAGLYYAMLPAMRTIHPLGATDPEECVFLLPHNGVHLTRVPMPGYRRWYDAHDFTPDYRYLKQQLQVMQRGNAPQWILKSPCHLGNLDALLRVFPDALIVTTHRDPAAALASWCSFCEATLRMHNRHVDLAEIGRTWLDFWTRAASAAEEVRRHATADFVDVGYEALAADPAGATAAIWDRIGRPLTGDERAALTVFAGRDRRRSPGTHRYTLERYGLDEAVVRAAFSTRQAA
ncbi:sulfotransferase family protein [Catenuloplanes sp. NPDC051500]|uniref:sulfotransferase family protein n=1 Tax=Catenuloplanes sp. NPDC051500 TaxID=3363959 RepID=UPI0037BA9D27